jgi:hypothetical protein
MTGFLRRAALAIAWLVIAAILSLGAAGIVGAMAHQPGTPSRAELTYAGDRAIEPGLHAAESELVLLSAQVAQLSDLGRDALGELAASNLEALDKTVANGEQLAIGIQTEATQLRQKLEGLPGLGPGAELTVSPELRRRHAVALDALHATDGIAADWTRLSTSSLAATRIAVLLTDHDKSTADAAAAGRSGKYADALKKLTASDATIADARRLRDSLAATVDVSTLGQWLDISAAYDKALRHLYEAIVKSKGIVTKEVRAAFDEEKKARERLPPDTRALVVILTDIGRGGLNQAVIGIEDARGDLDAAIDQLTASPSPSSDVPAGTGAGSDGGPDAGSDSSAAP